MYSQFSDSTDDRDNKAPRTVGLGVFETFMLFMLSPYFHSDDILGTLVVFRLVYYFVPLIAGIVLLSHNEINVRKKMLIRSHRRAISKISSFTPQIFSVLVFFAGMVLLFLKLCHPNRKHEINALL
jgi:phosphatidylglycerol lysyltransferase